MSAAASLSRPGSPTRNSVRRSATALPLLRENELNVAYRGVGLPIGCQGRRLYWGSAASAELRILQWQNAVSVGFSAVNTVIISLGYAPFVQTCDSYIELDYMWPLGL